MTEPKKRLVDELQDIERAKALPHWPETTAALARWMKERARGDGYAAVCIGYHGTQTARLLTEWAADEGLTVTDGVGHWMTPTMWLSWGRLPPVSGGFDVEVLTDGTLRWPAGKQESAT